MSSEAKSIHSLFSESGKAKAELIHAKRRQRVAKHALLAAVAEGARLIPGVVEAKKISCGEVRIKVTSGRFFWLFLHRDRLRGSFAPPGENHRGVVLMDLYFSRDLTNVVNILLKDTK